MFLPQKESKNSCKIHGWSGLPENYPIPCHEDLLFFIQRNQNKNTVIYKVNRNASNALQLNDPIDIHWKLYEREGIETPINSIQRKLAYGIDFEVINNEAIQMHVVSYPVFKIFVTKNDGEHYRAIAKINYQWSELSNVYLFADESGAFPQVKYLEIYGTQLNTGVPCYEKILISS